MNFLVNLLKKNIFNKYFSLCFIFVCTSFIQVFSQNLDCGTLEPSQQEYLNQLRAISQINSSSRNNNYSIPIHVIVIRDDSGNNPSGYNSAVISSRINAVNQYFTNGMSFYKCEETFINSSQYYNTNIGTVPYPLFHVYDAINLYIVNNVLGASAFTSFPENDFSSNIIVGEGGMSQQTLAHELGHFFNLKHTFSPVSQLNCTGTPVSLSDDCNVTGDGICDTPPDPGQCNCGGMNGCFDPCGGLYSGYMPDKFNLMSSYICRNSFTTQQLDRMKNTLMNGARKFLAFVDVNCNTIDLPGDGKVERVNQNNSLPNFDPFPNLTVKKRDLSQNSLIGSSTNSSGGYNTVTPIFGFEGSDMHLEPNDYPESFLNELLPTHGVSAFDMTRIRQHILNQVPLQKPYGLIAADVNNNGAVTASDLFQLNRLILHVIEEVPAGSWRYLPRMALDPSYNFESNFNNNPFTATWNSPTGTRSYLSSPSYLDQVEFNLSNNLISNEDTWSFNAIKVGDVNFSAILPGGSNLINSTSRNSLVNLIFNESDVCIKRGEEFILEFELEPDEAITGYQFGFDFNFEIMEFIKVKKGNFSKFDIENFGLTKMDENEFRTLWVDDEAKNSRFTLNNRKVFSLQLKALTEICNLKEFIVLNDRVLDNLLYNQNFKYTKGNLIVSVKKIKKVDLESRNQLGKIFPNPVKNTLHIDFTLDSQQLVSIQIIDAYGGVVSFEEKFQSGKYMEKLDISSLKEGILSCRISLGDNIYAAKAIKH